MHKISTGSGKCSSSRVNLSSVSGKERRYKAGHYDRKPDNNRNKHREDK